MMETGEIIAKANEAVQLIYEKMGRIESCEAALKALDGAEVYIGRNKTEILDLHSALNDDQIADIMTNIHTVIRAQIDKAAGELNMMCSKGADATTLPEKENEPPKNQDVVSGTVETCEPGKLESLTIELFGDKAAVKPDKKVSEETKAAAQETGTLEDTTSVSQKVKGGAKASKSTLTPDEEEKLLRKLYVTEGKTVKEIADIMGLSKSNIYDHIKKYGLRNKRYDREWDGYALESARRN